MFEVWLEIEKSAHILPIETYTLYGSLMYYIAIISDLKLGYVYHDI